MEQKKVWAVYWSATGNTDNNTRCYQKNYRSRDESFYIFFHFPVPSFLFLKLSDHSLIPLSNIVSWCHAASFNSAKGA